MAWPKTQGLPARRALGLRPGQGCLGPGSVPWALGLGSKPWALAGRALGPLGLYGGSTWGLCLILVPAHIFIKALLLLINKHLRFELWFLAGYTI